MGSVWRVVLSSTAYPPRIGGVLSADADTVSFTPRLMDTDISELMNMLLLLARNLWAWHKLVSRLPMLRRVDH